MSKNSDYKLILIIFLLQGKRLMLAAASTIATVMHVTCSFLRYGNIFAKKLI